MQNGDLESIFSFRHSMFVHSADKLAEMRTKFHIIQVKLIMSVWCFTVQCDYMNPGLLSAVLGCAESRVRATTVLVPVTGDWSGHRY